MGKKPLLRYLSRKGVSVLTEEGPGQNSAPPRQRRDPVPWDSSLLTPAEVTTQCGTGHTMVLEDTVIRVRHTGSG